MPASFPDDWPEGCPPEIREIPAETFSHVTRRIPLRRTISGRLLSAESIKIGINANVAAFPFARQLLMRVKL